MKFVYTAIVRPKDGIRDPQSDAMTEVLSACGKVDVKYVGRAIKLEIEAKNVYEADEILFDIRERYLVNPNLETCDVVENFCDEVVVGGLKELDEDAQKVLDENRWGLYEGDYDWVGDGPEVDLDVCPRCGGVADNGHDREFPPSPYWCTKCQKEME